MKNIFVSFLLILLCFHSLLAQEPDKTVSLTVSGSGKTQDEAKQSALRSAIEQAFGAFISSKTEILNDQVVADQMASVSSGNIQSFTIFNESQLPDGTWANTIKAIVSVSKLTSFVKSKGIAIEIKGGLFAINIKQQMLNEKGEIDAISEMVGLLHEPMQTAFDYSIKSGEPKSLDTENKNWEIPLEVTAKANKNMDFCANYCIKTLTAITLTTEEVYRYQSLNKAVFPVTIKYSNDLKTKTFYLRKKESLKLLDIIGNQWVFYNKLFTVESIFKKGNKKFEIISITNFMEVESPENDSNEKDLTTIKFNFLTKGQVASVFKLDDELTINNIENLTGYVVKSKGVISKFKLGGFVVYEKDGHGLVASFIDFGPKEIDDAITISNNLILNGFDDWHLPTLVELYALFINLKKLVIGGFKDELYWSSSIDKNSDCCISLNFYLASENVKEGESNFEYDHNYLFSNKFRPVRSF